MKLSNLKEIMDILSRTPQVFETMVMGLPQKTITTNEGGETWSVYDIIGHLIHGEKTDWIPRAKIILEHGPTRAFELFDRFAQFRDSQGKSLNDLLAEFAQRRKESLTELNSLEVTEEELQLKGTHPALGEVTLGQLLATWAVHDLNHIAQVARVIAKQYKEECGVWKEYLRIVNN